MSPLTIANLALSHIGEPFLDESDISSPTARVCNLHLPVVLKTILEGHHWSFATRTTTCLPIQDKDSILIADGLIADGSPISFPVLFDAGRQTYQPTPTTTAEARIFSPTGLVPPDLLALFPTAPAGYTTDYLLTITSLSGTGLQNLASAALIYKPYNPLLTAAWLVDPPDVTFGDFDPANINWANLTNQNSGGIPSLTITPGNRSISRWQYAWHLPADSLRLLTINGTDADLPSQRFEIQGRYLLTDTPDAPTIRYITAEPPVAEWPTTFLDAVAYALAARIAPILTQSENKVQAFTTLAEIALGKARSKDTRETRSAENMTPRRLAALSGLVRARYQNHTRPPY
jgi:hypothetical protein